MPSALQELPPPPQELAFGEVTLRFQTIVPADPSRGLVPYYHFRILLRDGTEVGHINFRIGQTRHIRISAGHIGYHIAEPFRGRAYALAACRAIAPFVRSVYPRVIITCDPDNHASRRTIEKLGARFIEEIEVPPDDPARQGGRRKKRYEWLP
jgi:tagatose 1,6-diphosphate aldolase